MTGLLQHWVTDQANRRPEAGALAFKGERLTYGALEQASNRLAHLLKEAECARGDRVCLLMPKSPAAIVALLAVLKADAMYVPLDPGSPAPRLAKMIDSCDNRWILASGSVGPTLEALFADPQFAGAHSVGWLDADPPHNGIEPAFAIADVSAYPTTPPPNTNTPEDPAHILFTSGSTGMPKGVVITHANVRRFIDWAVPYFGTAPTDRISGHPPLHFDLSGFDMFGTFAAGAELYLVPPEANLLPHQLAGLIRSAELTQWFSVPSVLNYMAKFDVVKQNDFPSLRRVLWCGEVFPTPALVHWMRRLPHVTFTNLYGPTEATIASSYYTVPACPTSEDEQIPIGQACGGEELLVLDEALNPVPPGEAGDLYIGGAGLSPGYWRDAEKTRAAFVQAPGGKPGDRIYRTGDLATVGTDGLVRFLGRADSQIKTRGYRVELGEIETALHALGMLRECAVLGVPSHDFDGVAICCAYVPALGTDVTPARLREALARVLPPYMLPSRWWAFEELPKTGNGKIDRRKLKELGAPETVGAP
ncbi:MAG TPA: amino acid adenylation domain-containing protein [Gemmatimonadales bacterium]|nr:amino acid adenylation domain-containing protein [Gemmatimonadales bacterium]